MRVPPSSAVFRLRRALEESRPTSISLSLFFSPRRRRVKTLQKPAHTPEESIAATGMSKPDKVQRGAEPIVKWSASHSTVVKGAGAEDETKAMDV